ncbi:putative signal transducing protein [Proteus hauseri]|uniref:putative signal transducing protein n=1 Tax=Proteus hauseri TaxID=183417 RepID=UPI0032DBB3DB
MWNIHPTRGHYKLLAQYLSPIDASIEAGLLQSEGIDAILLDENIVWNNQVYAQATGGVKLLVNDKAFEQAQTILNELYQGKYNINEQLEPIDCELQVAVKNNKTDYLNMGFVFLIYAVLGLPLPFKSQQPLLSNNKENSEEHNEKKSTDK